ncbi:MAG: tRNA uridine-5-carboxymethylaminomethyl(34) synthesis GTPase MnmE [Candidatus Cybelea sp.]
MLDGSSTTIVAVATPPGKGAVGIVRASGPSVPELVHRLVQTKSRLRRRVATYATIVDENGELLDRGLAIFFEAPHSYTGEDLLELQIHGSPVVGREVVRAMLACGARLAEPGEFTRRAFFNGKMALHAAAAVADIIDAQTRCAARAALANFESGLAQEVRAVRSALATILQELEGAIDFPDEVPEPARGGLRERLAPIRARLERLARDGELGRLVREGLGVAIVGPPNAGKSSLLNALLGSDRAIVSDFPGTTRDTIEESVVVDGVPVRLIDTAGIRSHADRLEAHGIARTERALDSAAIALVVADGSQRPDSASRQLIERTRERPRILFLNKADLGTDPTFAAVWPGAIVGSVRNPETLERIRDAIASTGWNGERFDATRPHLAGLHEFEATYAAIAALERARDALEASEPIDFVATELAHAFSQLGHVSEQVAAEEIVTGIFSRFCIGK